MRRHNPDNERIKREYFTFLKEAKRHSEATIDAAAKALNRFEQYTKFKEFKTFRSEQAIAFKRHLAEQTAEQSGARLSKATLYSTLTQLKRFFQWLAGQPGFRSRVQYSDAEYFNLSDKETRVATAKREQRSPTLEQVTHVLDSMPISTDVQRRNRAVIAFTLLTGARDSAIASLQLKHVDLVAGCVHQDARVVKTKFSKTFTTYFFPLRGDVVKIVEAWIRELKEERLWGNHDPLFPATRVAVGANRHFEVVGLKRAHWSSASPIRTIFREAFELSGLQYFNPHSFRKTLVSLGQVICKSPEDFKAFSQNLGHEEVLTTFRSYGEVASNRQAEIIRGLGREQERTLPHDDQIIDGVIRKLAIQAARESEDKC
jgi:integrase